MGGHFLAGTDGPCGLVASLAVRSDFSPVPALEGRKNPHFGVHQGSGQKAGSLHPWPPLPTLPQGRPPTPCPKEVSRTPARARTGPFFPQIPEFPNQRQPAPLLFWVPQFVVSLPFLLNPSLSRVNSVLPLGDEPLLGGFPHPHPGG